MAQGKSTEEEKTKLNFTEYAIGKLKAPHPSGKQVLFWDTKLPAFGVACSGVSEIKTYFVRGRVRGRSIRPTIGRVGLMTLEEARRQAKEMMVEFAGGVDRREKTRTGDQVTLRGALENYLNLKRLKPRSQEEMRAIVERHLSGWLDLPLWSITRDMVDKRHKAIAEEVEQHHRAKAAEEAKRHLKRAERTETHWPEAAARHRAKYEAAKARKPYAGRASANGAMRALRAIWNFMADRVDDPPRNPVRLKGQWYKVQERTRLVKPHDLSAFYKAVMALPNPVVRDYVLVLLFSGLRRREAASLRWKEDIDLPGRIIYIAADDTKPGRKLDLPMSDFVYDLLVARRSLGDAKYVFPATSESGHIAEPKSNFEQIADATDIRVSPHDLRRTFITIAESCDLSPFALKALVNHSLGRSVTEGYIQMSAERLREPVQRVADKIEELCGVREPRGKNVTKIRKARVVP
jgi:integrase